MDIEKVLKGINEFLEDSKVNNPLGNEQRVSKESRLGYVCFGWLYVFVTLMAMIIIIIGCSSSGTSARFYSILGCIVLFIEIAFAGLICWCVFRSLKHKKECIKEVQLKQLEVKRGVVHAVFADCDQSKRIGGLEKEKQELEKKYDELLELKEECLRYKIQSEELKDIKEKYDKLREDIENNFLRECESRRNLLVRCEKPCAQEDNNNKGKPEVPES